MFTPYPKQIKSRSTTPSRTSSRLQRREKGNKCSPFGLKVRSQCCPQKRRSIPMIQVFQVQFRLSTRWTIGTNTVQNTDLKRFRQKLLSDQMVLGSMESMKHSRSLLCKLVSCKENRKLPYFAFFLLEGTTCPSTTAAWGLTTKLIRPITEPGSTRATPLWELNNCNDNIAG